MGTTETSPRQRGAVRRAVESARGTGRTLASVFTNRNLRNIQLAFAGSVVGDWAYATAVTVWTYQAGGAAAVGVFMAARFVAMTVAAPTGAVLADKFSRKAFMMVADATRAVLVLAATACVAFGLEPAVYVLALAAAVVGAPFRAAQAGLIPRLARTPEELTASNATASNLENVAVFAGPALGALLIAVLDVEVVFLFNAATFMVSFLLVSRIQVPAAERSSELSSDHDTATDGPPPSAKRGFFAELGAGFHTILTNRGVGLVAILAGTQGLVWGALSVYLVILSVDVLDAGAHGVGYLSSVMGLATVVGGGVVLARVNSKRTARDMTLGVLGWSLPLLAVAAWPTPAVLFAGVAVIGLSDPAVNLGFDTIPQRIVPDRVLSRVFGAMEAALVGAMSVGAVAAPFLVRVLGLRGSLLLVGALGAVVALACLPRMRGLDEKLASPAGLDRLQALPLFSPLGRATLESLAHALKQVQVPAGEAVVREGDAADKFFVIDSGLVEVTQQERFLRREGPGEFFGEIGLLRDVPRTATVVAVEDTVLWTLDRRSFLDAVVGHQDARRAAEDIASMRLAV
jgi:MFS family permease